MHEGTSLILASYTSNKRKMFTVLGNDLLIIREGSYESCKGLIDGRSDKFMEQHPLRPEAVKALKALRKKLVNG